MPESAVVPTALHREAFRYVLSGCGAAGADLSTYSLLTGACGLAPEVANLVSRPVGGIVSFLLHKHFTFGNRGRAATHVQFGRFGMVWLSTFAISQGLVVVFHRAVRFGPLLTKITAEGGAGVFSFLCQRSWTFR